MFCSVESLATLLLLGVGLMAATIHLQSQSQQMSNSIVAPPMIAMAKQQGPWPKCVGLTGEECSTYIASSTSRESSLEIDVVDEGTLLAQDFKKDRVRIFVDENGIVNAIPGRG